MRGGNRTVDMPIGSQWNLFTVVGRGAVRNGKALWWCRCVCGKTLEIAGYDLRRGMKSCGCSSGHGPDMTPPVGQVFGDWVVVGSAEKGSRGQTQWTCQCTCGETRPVGASRVRSGASTGCGCKTSAKIRASLVGRRRPLRDPKYMLEGQTFGYLVVRHRSDVRIHRSFAWVCDCKCGTETLVRGYDLMRGVTASCGCRVVEKAKDTAERNRKPAGEALARSLMASYRRHAYEKGVVFELPETDWFDLIRQPCHYCGEPPAQRLARNGATLIYNGVDRMERGLGYISGNVVPACGRCNVAKGRMGYKEFLSWVNRVANHRPSD
jgi:hypothetical protein